MEVSTGRKAYRMGTGRTCQQAWKTTHTLAGISRPYLQVSHGYSIQFDTLIVRYHDFWPPWQEWTLKGSLKTIPGEATSYFYYKTGLAGYSKNHIAQLFSRHMPHFSHLSAFELASYRFLIVQTRSHGARWQSRPRTFATA
jgi:hypothetical protein